MVLIQKKEDILPPSPKEEMGSFCPINMARNGVFQI